MKGYSDKQVIEEIRSWGIPLEKMFLIGEGEGPDFLIGLWLDDIGFRFNIIEDDKLAESCVACLQRLGVRRFKSAADVYELAGRENWPGYGR